MIPVTGRKKGLVLETSEEGYITVVTGQGEFLTVPWSKTALPETGSEVEFALAGPKEKFYLRRNYFLAIAASLVLLLLSIPLWWAFILPGPSQVVAYVNVDINPSIELGLNRPGKVKEVRGLNQDGERLLQDLKLMNLPAQKAVELLTIRAVAEKYLTPDKENTVLITVSHEHNFSTIVKELDQQVSKVLQEHKISGQAETIEVTLEMRARAKTLNVSPGKYAILLQAMEDGLDLTLEDIQKKNLVKAIKEAGGVPGQLISRVRHEQARLNEVEERLQEKIEQQRNKEMERQKNREMEQRVPDSKPPGEKENAGNKADKEKNSRDIQEMRERLLEQIRNNAGPPASQPGQANDKEKGKEGQGSVKKRK